MAEIKSDILHILLEKQGVKTLLDIFTKNNIPIRFVGGCVRDALIGYHFDDIDLTTHLKPEAVMELLQNHNIHVIPTGLKHGTVTAHIDHHNYEITTLRKDVACDGRHAEVEFSDDWQEDAARRDFTMNALSLSSDGLIYDYFDGISDLKTGTIRFIGDAKTRISEDYLRILRYFRFYAKYGKTDINQDYLNLFADHHFFIEQLSGERIYQEFSKILHSDKLIYVLEKMQESRILEHITIDYNDFAITKNLIKITSGLAIKPHNLTIFSSLIKLEQLNNVSSRLKLSNKEKSWLTFVLSKDELYQYENNKNYLKAYRKLKDKDLLLNKLLFILSYNNEVTAIDIYQKIKNLLHEYIIPILPITGDDLIKLGIKPGKELGELLQQAETYWEDNDYLPSKEELLEFIKQV